MSGHLSNLSDTQFIDTFIDITPRVISASPRTPRARSASDGAAACEVRPCCRSRWTIGTECRRSPPAEGANMGPGASEDI